MAHTVHILADSMDLRGIFAPSWRGDLHATTVRDLHVTFAARPGLRSINGILQRVAADASGSARASGGSTSSVVATGGSGGGGGGACGGTAPTVRWLAAAGWDTTLADAGVTDGDTLIIVRTSEMLDIAPLERFATLSGAPVTRSHLMEAMRGGEISWDADSGTAVVWTSRSDWHTAIRAAALSADASALPRATSRLLRIAATYAADAACTSALRYNTVATSVFTLLTDGARLTEAADLAYALTALLAIPSYVPSFILSGHTVAAHALTRDIVRFVTTNECAVALFGGGTMLASLATRLRTALEADDSLNDTPPLAALARTLARVLHGGALEPAWLGAAARDSGAHDALAALFACRFAAAGGLHWAPLPPQAEADDDAHTRTGRNANADASASGSGGGGSGSRRRRHRRGSGSSSSSSSSSSSGGSGHGMDSSAVAQHMFLRMLRDACSSGHGGGHGGGHGSRRS